LFVAPDVALGLRARRRRQCHESGAVEQQMTSILMVTGQSDQAEGVGRFHSIRNKIIE
jgi:hypothetical protein